MKDSKERQSLFLDLRANNKELENLTDEQLNLLLFKLPSGLRLTKSGKDIFKKIYKSYTFSSNYGSLKSKHLIELYNRMKFPYYITGKIIVLFSSEDAFILSLYSETNTWLENTQSD